MAEYIEREAVLNHLRECEGTPPEIGYTYPIFKALECFVEDVPAADVVPVVHGHWDEGVNNGYCCCSNCRDVYILQEWLTDGKWNYCPNCGARMDGTCDV